MASSKEPSSRAAVSRVTAAGEVCGTAAKAGATARGVGRDAPPATPGKTTPKGGNGAGVGENGVALVGSGGAGGGPLAPKAGARFVDIARCPASFGKRRTPERMARSSTCPAGAAIASVGGGKGAAGIGASGCAGACGDSAAADPNGSVDAATTTAAASTARKSIWPFGAAAVSAGDGSGAAGMGASSCAAVVGAPSKAGSSGATARGSSAQRSIWAPGSVNTSVVGGKGAARTTPSE
mmetsp:Transcript_50842/g.148131  ORF Transcript_50842/g.148131 Transcript_50842/m.148131 type:complete len:238 (+) Transcript_50842:252-965(+)